MSKHLEFHGGTVGALAPFFVFLGGVVWLAMAGAPDERGFWPILLAALTVGLILARDRERYGVAVVSSIGQPIVALMVLAWLIAGVLGALLSESGLIQSLVWLAQRVGAGAPSYVAASFLACALISTSTGTSFGTLLVAGPLLYSAGGALGAHPAILMGAILGGATFGDSISPVSDTTIASAGSQHTDISGTVRSRLKYVLPAGAIALICSMVLAGSGEARVVPVVAAAAGSPRAIIMLIVPAIVVGMLIRKRTLLEGLLAGVVLTVAIGLMLGLIEPARLFYIDREAYGARGLLIDGMGRGVGVSIFTLLLMGLVGSLQESGVIERMARSVRPDPSSAWRSEVWIVSVVSVAVLLTTHSVVALLAVGPLTRDIGERAGLHPYRRANLLDLTVCTYPFLLPYFLPTIIASTVTAGAAEFGMPRLSPMDIGVFNTYAWTLVVTIVVVIVTGYGRRRG